MQEHAFMAKLEIIGINPFVYVPEAVLESIFMESGMARGPIPISGAVNGAPYRQTLVRHKGAWRLYVNTSMLKDSPKRVGEQIRLTVAFDPEERAIQAHPKWDEALNASPKAKAVFENLPKSRQTEIVRYISSLKTEESVERNVCRAIRFLLGNDRFIGRDKP